MLYCILKQCSPAELAEGENAEEVKDLAEAELSKAQQKVKKKLVLRNKREVAITFKSQRKLTKVG